ncbi:MAG: thioredoxin-like domain-containing protein [Polyangiaceae bacterium]
MLRTTTRSRVWRGLAAGLVGVAASAMVLAGCGGATTGGEPARGAASTPSGSGKDARPALAIPDGPTVDLRGPSERLEVPGFDGATQWLNVDRPLKLDDLKGRVVVVDFWTSCCINCLQTLPTLEKLEATYRGLPVVVVGVHSPKFDEESDAERLVDIVLDNRIAHPVASDGDMRVWRAWGVEAWPTLLVLDPDGKAVWGSPGEPDFDELSAVVRTLLREGQDKGTLAAGDFERLRPEKDTSGALRYPGKVVALASGGMAIADTGHHRVVVVDKDGKVELIAGTGEPGRKDGSLTEATFTRPQGIAEALGDLYVADTGNHALRKIDRRAGTVTTVAGTGELGGYFRSNALRPAKEVALRSPWDLAAVDDKLFVALAGSHQIALFLPKTGELRLYAGSGQEARLDGDLLDAAFAQPSGLAWDGKRGELFVLDSETSSVRAIDPAKGKVRTVVGKDLFVFGDKDGDRETARLQHPIGLTLTDGALFVADSYNSKVKRIDPDTGATRTLFGGRDDAVIDEPAGLTILGTDLIVADTNHHRLLRIPKLGTGTPEPITLRGVDAK